MNVPGALLFMGDGHALQGAAGELTGNALETSMEIEFMASGIADSLDRLLRRHLEPSPMAG